MNRWVGDGFELVPNDVLASPAESDYTALGIIVTAPVYEARQIERSHPPGCIFEKGNLAGVQCPTLLSQNACLDISASATYGSHDRLSTVPETYASD